MSRRLADLTEYGSRLVDRWHYQIILKNPALLAANQNPGRLNACVATAKKSHPHTFFFIVNHDSRAFP
jgi:hypothetical protein